MIGEFKELSAWIDLNHCSFRMKKHGNKNNVDDRVCFIEKTPRVRVRYYSPDDIKAKPIGDIWVYGPSGDGHLCGRDNSSREWCDKMLELLGWE